MTGAETPSERPPILAAVVAFLSEQLATPAEAITPSTSFRNDLKADSLRMVELALHLEETLGVRLEEEQMKSIDTVADLVSYVEARLPPGSA